MKLRDNDLQLLEEKGINQATIDEQIKRFEEGFPFIKIEKASTPGDGIKRLSEEELSKFVREYEDRDLRTLKFVPASGAASRMFKDLFSFLEKYSNQEVNYDHLKHESDLAAIFDFFKHIEKFAFFQDLKSAMEKDGYHLEESLLKRNYSLILEYLLDNKGLNYGNLPKGLLKFHRYEDSTRTPVEEHLVEGANYCKSEGQVVYLHFTVPPAFREDFKKLIQAEVPVYEKMFGVTYNITFSIQDPSTDTIAVDLQNKPFREDDGSLLFRPGGHGSLLYNINQFDHDLIFIKNIDNVAPDWLKKDTFQYKKALAGILLNVQKKIFTYLQLLEQPVSDEKVSEMIKFVEYELCVVADNLNNQEQKVAFLKKKLNRPIRVCGMVKNEGEPGGGPYWAKCPDGSVSLQIIESSQVDMNNDQQKQLFNNATHFNPVDIIAAVKDNRGNKFDLMKYTDPATGFISKKSKSGRELKALEHPGLWNGAMSDWNTIFVEVPVTTFTPVKTVNDLLRQQHQPL